MAQGTDRDNPQLPGSPSLWSRLLDKWGFRNRIITPEDSGLVPASLFAGGTASKFLREDGTWDTPASAGGGITQLTSDVVAGPGSGSVAATIATDAVTTTKIADANVTYAKIQNVTQASRLLGTGSAAAGTVVEISVSSGITMSGTAITAPGIATNATAIEANETAIAANTASASTNAAAITANTTAIGVNTGAIVASASLITANTTNIAKRIMRCCFHANATGNITINSSTDQFLSNSNRNIQLVDLSGYTHVRLSHRTVTKNNGSDGARLIARYVTSYTQTVGSYVNMGAGDTPTEVNSTLEEWNIPTSGWVALDSNAQRDGIYLAVLQNGGDGTTTRAASVMVEFK